MASPFLSFAFEVKDNPEFAALIKSFEKEDDDVIARRKYTRNQLKIQRQLSRTKSIDNIDENFYKNKKTTKNHLNNNAGILMVYRKKPFNVRFDLERNQTIQ